MSQTQGAERFVTPEAVAVTLDVAGLGSRMIATLVDSAIQGLVFFLVAFAIAGLGLEGVSAGAAGLAAAFLLFWGYFFVFEGLWNGQTPGKRAQGIRVVRADGQPVGWTHVVVRNLLRLVDLLPGFYAVGAMTILLTRRDQRLGDLAAGTVVIRERKAPIPRPLPPMRTTATEASGLDASDVSEPEYSVIRSFLERRDTLVPSSRQQLAVQLATMIRPKLGRAGAQFGDDESLLEAVAASYRARFGPDASGQPLPPPPT